MPDKHPRKRGMGRALLDVLLPSQCAGCGQWDEVLCEGCASLATCAPHKARVEGRNGDLRALILGEYEGPLRRIVLAAKHAPRANLSDFLLEAGQNLGSECARSWRTLAGGDTGGKEETGSPEKEEGTQVPREIWVIPAPASWKRRLGGRPVVLPIAMGLARGLANAGMEGIESVRVVDAVRLKVGASSQSGKSGQQRGRGRAGTMYALVDVPADVGVIVVDDVVTTGATVREMERVLGRVDIVAALCRPGLIS